MEVLKFTLSGKNAFFKKPEVNSYYYFTYGNIHKVALLGLLGAILGYGGYIQMKKEEEYPEFYQRLKELQISIAPDPASKGSFSRKIQNFNNSVGYASAEEGGNLIVKQQWLEEPRWDIYIKLDSREAERIKEYILSQKCIFFPYLGSNDHPADITDVQICRAEKAQDMEEERIDSLFPRKWAVLDFDEEPGKPYLYEEYLPIGLNEKTLLYQTDKFFFTNIPIADYSCDIYRIEGKHIVFF